MKTAHSKLIRWLTCGAAVILTAYAACVGAILLIQSSQSNDETTPDPHLEGLMPVYDIAERFRVPVAAPADRTFAAACALDLLNFRLVRMIFRLRRLLMGSLAPDSRQPAGLVERAKAWGWATLASRPGHEIIFGAATQPWVATPVFRALQAKEFRGFREPGFVKIVWTLRVEATARDGSVAITETRALATDATARTMFRVYWMLVWPGTALIRILALRALKRAVERQASVAAVPLTGRRAEPANM